MQLMRVQLNYTNIINCLAIRRRARLPSMAFCTYTRVKCTACVKRKRRRQPNGGWFLNRERRVSQTSGSRFTIRELKARASCAFPMVREKLSGEQCNRTAQMRCTMQMHAEIFLSTRVHVAGRQIRCRSCVTNAKCALVDPGHGLRVCISELLHLATKRARSHQVSVNARTCSAKRDSSFEEESCGCSIK